MTTYKGYKHSACGPQLVVKDDEILSPAPSQRIVNHSPSGFQWGYGGSGPAQLALSLLYYVTADRGVSSKHHQDFKRQFVAGWGDEWQITSEEILYWLESEKNE